MRPAATYEQRQRNSLFWLLPTDLAASDDQHILILDLPCKYQRSAALDFGELCRHGMRKSARESIGARPWKTSKMMKAQARRTAGKTGSLSPSEMSGRASENQSSDASLTFLDALSSPAPFKLSSKFATFSSIQNRMNDRSDSSSTTELLT